jgi:CBS domain-containing protein
MRPALHNAPSVSVCDDIGRLARRNQAPTSIVDIAYRHAVPLQPAGSREATMTVKAILSNKGSDVFTIDPTTTLETAVGILSQRHIGALVVLGAEQRVIGIVSERDVVLALAARGAKALDEPLSQVMTRKVYTCSQEETVSAIMERMTTGKFRHVPVVEQERLVGIISIGDVVKHRLTEMARESEALRDYIQTA